ncbi:MAG: homoserine dehydrogenase, partial [Candidatus Koribacter versatilis]|nr:homoserine dehydrogenase [Candidatus Koribacter versatilis]
MSGTSKFDATGKQNAGTATHDAKVWNVAIVGFGTVGNSVARILCERAPSPLRLTHICNRSVARKKVDWLPPSVQWTESFEDVLSSDVDIVVEVMGGLQPTEDWIRRALASGKSVVTANKQLISRCGPELISLARSMHQEIAFGASVAGGVPVISGLHEGLAGDDLFKICGILNGTCNYILSQIESNGVSFATALREAQKLGFAEADPTEDIDGLDARAKLAILARVGLHCNVQPASILCRSISAIDSVDFEYANQLGCTIRQISMAELKGDQLFAAVQPALVELSSPLARVEGSQNLVMSTGTYGGETVFGGHGAGGHPTAVAVVSDILAIARSKQAGVCEEAHAAEITPKVTADFATRHYLRFLVKDRPGIIATLATILAEYDINIEAVLQKPGCSKSALPFLITLEECRASLVEQALQKIALLDFLVHPCLHLPILVG